MSYDVTISTDADDGYSESTLYWEGSSPQPYIRGSGAWRPGFRWSVTGIAEDTVLEDPTEITYEVDIDGASGNVTAEIHAELINESGSWANDHSPHTIIAAGDETVASTTTTISAVGSKTEDVKAVIQEVVNLTGFDDPSYINILFNPTAGGGDYFRLGDSETGDAARLVITTPAAGGATPKGPLGHPLRGALGGPI